MVKDWGLCMLDVADRLKRDAIGKRTPNPFQHIKVNRHPGQEARLV